MYEKYAHSRHRSRLAMDGFCSINLMTFKWVRPMGICFSKIGNKSSYTLPMSKMYTRVSCKQWISCASLVNNFHLFAFWNWFHCLSFMFMFSGSCFLFELYIHYVLHNVYARLCYACWLMVHRTVQTQLPCCMFYFFFYNVILFICCSFGRKFLISSTNINWMMVWLSLLWRPSHTAYIKLCNTEHNDVCFVCSEANESSEWEKIDIGKL